MRNNLPPIPFNLRYQLVRWHNRPQDEFATASLDIRLHFLDTFCCRPNSTSGLHRLSRKGKPFEELLCDLLSPRLVVTDVRQDQDAGFTGIHLSSILVTILHELRQARLEILWGDKRGKPPIAKASCALDCKV